ncbi:CpsD/CapB family tyrosine-protein kinase [Rhizorhapis suberifaciens]|uniref:Mrp family chromosome partitioning ATPase n=1 Tax=Rhizorhapis suberifaciens TaxID=13656 RepID=A0A840HTP6_9SPHN|nr:CpsD/CapB family tyrosine-protein kinase [Rhizorhapis suberifaciens]MBB4640979.1 Mrp family chromosome partitioning ATPase [Rhizorhapis suberifaciens]
MSTGLNRILSSALPSGDERVNVHPDVEAWRRHTVRLDRARLVENGIFGFDNLDPRAQSFVFLRWQLLNGFVRSGGRVIAVTSTRPGDGKTFITTNLAAALSRVRPTVLLDLDLRRPAVGWRFGLSAAAGIDDYLSGGADAWDVVQNVEDMNLGIVPVRVPQPQSPELLTVETLPQLLSALRGRSDDPICLIDTPPVLVVDDILLFAQHLDGVLLVVEEGKTRADEVREALRLMEAIPLVGTVLNRSIFSGRRRDFDQSYYYR